MESTARQLYTKLCVEILELQDQRNKAIQNDQEMQKILTDKVSARTELQKQMEQEAA